MTQRFQSLRSQWLPYLAVFLAGLLAGWLIIGWLLWPVTYSNALPQDLRANERDQYLLMTAESFAINNNVELAQRRVSTWAPADLANDLSTLQNRVAGQNAVQASQVQRLTQGLGVQAVAPQAGQARGGVQPTPLASASPLAAPKAQVQPVATSQSQAATSPQGRLQSICTGAGAAVLVVLGAVAIVLLWRRWRSSQSVENAPALYAQGPHRPSTPDVGQGEPFEATVDAPGVPESLQALTRAPWAGRDSEPVAAPRVEFTDDEPDIPVAAPPRRPVPSGKPMQPAGESNGPAEVTWRPVNPAPSPARPAGEPVTLTSLSEYRATYQMGEPDYDEAFDIHDAGNVYVGQCGLGLTNPVGRSNDQAAALQVWLWDTNDPDTQVKVLISEAAYRDTALRDQLAGDHPAIPVRQRTDFELQTYNLLLRGVVEKLEYAEQEPAHGIFAEVVVRLTVYKRS